MKRRYRRRKFILHTMQIKLILALFGVIAAVSTVLVAETLVLVRNNATALHISPELVTALLNEVIWPVIITMTILFLASLWALILATHKIYGPLYRLRVYFKKLCDGEPTDELRFRRGDATHGLQEIYNDLRQSLEKTLHYDYKEMVKIFADLQHVLDRVHAKEIEDKELSDSLQGMCDRLAKALDKTSEAIHEE